MTHAAEIAIRTRRAAFNTALAQGDLAAISRLLAPAAILIAGTDSALLSGRKAQLAAWKREFAAPDPTLYRRMPDKIVVSPVEPIALEHGHWQGALANGQVLAHGTYTAKWRQVGQNWVIEGELFLTLG
jgi:ketosteroid isomerase-like protein